MPPASPASVTNMNYGPSLLQAVAALLVVIGLILFISWLLRRFAFGGQFAKPLGRHAQQRRLAITESLWLDARHRLLVVEDGTDPARCYTLVLGPGQALQLAERPTDLPHAQAVPAPAIDDIAV